MYGPYLIAYLIAAGIILLFVIAHARIKYDRCGAAMHIAQALLTYTMGAYILAGEVNSVPKLIVLFVSYVALAFFLEKAKKKHMKTSGQITTPTLSSSSKIRNH